MPCHREQLQTHDGPRVTAHPGPRHSSGSDRPGRGRGAQNTAGGTLHTDVRRQLDALPAGDQTDQPVLPILPGATQLPTAAAATQANQPQTHREPGPRPRLEGAAHPVQPLICLDFMWTFTFDMHVCVSPPFIVQVMRSYCR